MNYPLCIDLDGTLISNDSLQEAVISFTRHNPLRVFLILYWILIGGKAYLKQQVMNRVQLEPSKLLYNVELLEWVKNEKQKHRKIVLVTAADKSFADSVANYLNIFDDIFASDGSTNLNSHRKEDLLNKQYGEKKYDYVGNSFTDLSVWRSAYRAIIVSNNPILLRKVKKIAEITRIFRPNALTIKELFKALRVHQYAKNFLIFIPIIAAHIIFNPALWGQTLLAFVSFCFMASGVYLVNDILDIEADRGHKNKKNRAIAGGLLTIGAAIWMAVVLIALAFMCSWILPLNFRIILLFYCALTLLYSLSLKNKLLMDVIVLAILYTMRIIAGMALLTTKAYSTWLLLFSLFFFLSLAFLKRISEFHLLKEENKTAMIGRAYQINHFNILKIFGISSGLLSILVFALYLNSPDALILYKYPQMLLFVPPILVYWIMRIWLLAVEGKINDDPILFAIRDRVSYYCVALILLIMFLAAK